MGAEKMIVSRRGVLDLGLATAAAVTLPVVTLPAAALAERTGGPQAGDVLVAVDDQAHTPLRVEMLPPGSAPIVAWPMDAVTRTVRNQTRNNQILVLRLAENAVEVPADTVVAYSAICPHAGCLVSGWLASANWLLCPCHGSEYDAAKHGAIVGGPAPQPLPSLPVRVVDGIITVAGPFSAPPGGHTSRTM
jgi:rieske iron-sulfur protein